MNIGKAFLIISAILFILLILFSFAIWVAGFFESDVPNNGSQLKKIKDVQAIQKPSQKLITDNTNTKELLDKAKDYRIKEPPITGELLDRKIKELPRQEVHHVHHVHVTHEKKSKNTEDENKDHTAAVWERLGYQVKAGENYSYKFYGREIYKPHQVVKAGQYQVVKAVQYRARIASSGLTEKQLKVKTLGLALVENTGSKRVAKDILVNDYGFNENTAKYAVGYRGYDDY